MPDGGRIQPGPPGDDSIPVVLYGGAAAGGKSDALRQAAENARAHGIHVVEPGGRFPTKGGAFGQWPNGDGDGVWPDCARCGKHEGGARTSLVEDGMICEACKGAENAETKARR